MQRQSHSALNLLVGLTQPPLQGTKSVNARYAKHNLDFNSPRTQQACLNLGLTMEDLLQKSKQQVHDNKLSDEGNELKFQHYINRVNESVRAIVFERRELLKRNFSNTMPIDQIFGETGKLLSKNRNSNLNKRPQTNAYYSLQQSPDAIEGYEINSYQVALLQSQSKNQIAKVQNELREFLRREKQRDRVQKKSDKKLKTLEAFNKKKREENKEKIKFNEMKREQTQMKKKRLEKEFQKSIERLENKEIGQSVMSLTMKQTQSMMAIQQRMQVSEQYRKELDLELDKKIEEEKHKIIEKQIKSAIIHEIKLEETRDKLRERYPISNIKATNQFKLVQERKEKLLKDQVFKDLISEVGYLSKIDKIQQNREKQEKNFKEKQEILNLMHQKKIDQKLRHQKIQQREQELKQRQIIEKEQQMTINKYQSGAPFKMNSQLKLIEQRKFLKTAGSMQGLFIEKNVIKREVVHDNLEREKRKQEWKKLNVLAKEKLFEERVKFQKESQRMLMNSQCDMRIKENKEREKIMETIQCVRNAPFSPNSKKIVSQALPQSYNQEIEEIYKDSSEERRKKKLAEKNNE